MTTRTAAITVVWEVKNAKEFLSATPGDSSLVRQSDSFDAGAWRINLSRSKTNPDDIAARLYASPLKTEYTSGSREKWERSGTFGWSFQVLQDEKKPPLVDMATTKSGWGNTEGRVSNWGWPSFLSAVDLLQEPFIEETDTFLFRLTLSTAPYTYDPPLPPDPPPPSPSLLRAYEGFFESATATDVKFLLVGEPTSNVRSLSANKAFLSQRLSYFRSMFGSGFSEESAADERPNKRQKCENESPVCFQLDDDDSVEWLPRDSLEAHGSPEEDSVIALDAEEQSTEVDQADTAGKTVVRVTDAGYITYRAMLYYLYTEKIAFTPSAHNFTVELEKTPPSHPDTADSSRDDLCPSTPFRRAYLLAKTDAKGLKEGVEPASPHAIYRLADKLDIPDLKKLARSAIIGGFTTQNILYELISSFAYHYDEIQKAALDFAWKNWDAVKSTPAFGRVFAGASDIEGGSTILAKLVMGLPAPGGKE